MSIRILRHHVQLPILVLMLLEAMFAIVALIVVATHAGTVAIVQALPHWSTPPLFALAVLVANGAMGLYNTRLREHLFGLALRFLLVSVALLAAIGIVLYSFPTSRLAIPDFATAIALTAGASLVGRFLLGRFVSDGFLKTRVLVYGAGKQAQSIANLKRRSDRMGFLVVGYLPASAETRCVPDSKVVDPGGDLLAYCEAHDVDEIVVAMDDRRQEFPLRELLHCRINGIDVLELVTFLERETGAVRLDVLNPSWIIFSPGFKRSWARDLVGRLLDITASIALLAVAWPFMLLSALAIKLEDGIAAPVLYRQHRVGNDGKLFKVYKFRSMTVDAEADGVARWASEEDLRVTRVGAFLRRSRFDELPQLLNVLRGDMRFVGPRPERPEFVSHFVETLPYYGERHSVPPGLTGWAQLCYPYGSSEQDAIEKLKYDLYYIKNRSFLFDLAILIQTVEVIIFGKGAR
ncbi:MAG TPA: TIGR03013 family XrtA/PEP-CTERM system glycosyltransferase [Steroidobacteraceae bacterium]|nr:TIGR03013 family XrtA/PEP-CTERM system glycosyltransferase [Steroidobacteraceae bacterium]